MGLCRQPGFIQKGHCLNRLGSQSEETQIVDMEKGSDKSPSVCLCRCVLWLYI